MWSRMNMSEGDTLWFSSCLNSSLVLSKKTPELESLETSKQRQGHWELSFYSCKLKISFHLLKKASNLYFYLRMMCLGYKKLPWGTISAELWKVNNKIQLLKRSGNVVSVKAPTRKAAGCPMSYKSYTEHREQTPHQALWQHQELQRTNLLGACYASGKPRRWPWLSWCPQATAPSPLCRAEAVSELAPVGAHRMSRACGLCQLWKSPGCHLFPSHCPVPRASLFLTYVAATPRSSVWLS